MYMPRPDEHPQLVEMGIGEATCDHCTYDLFPHKGDDACDDCSLNPLKDPGAKAQFFRDAIEREFSLPPEEANIRFALGSLASDQPTSEL